MKEIAIKIDTAIKYFENFIIGTGLIIISVIIFINVICRYFFGFTIVWVEEFSRYIVVWLTFIGVGACARYSEHITIDIIINKLPQNIKKWALYFIEVIILLAALALTYIGFLSTQTLFLSGNKSATIGFPIWLIYTSVPIGFALLTYHCLRNIQKIRAEEMR